jgi:hypothetical protein
VGLAGVAVQGLGVSVFAGLYLDGLNLARVVGRAITAFFNEIGAFVKEHGGDAEMKPFVGPLEVAAGHLQQATMWFVQNAMAKPDNAGAGATDYLHLLGLVALAYMWAQIAKAAQARLASEADGAAVRLQAKLATGRFFMQHMLPETATRLARVQAGADSVMALPAEAF